MSVYVDDMRAPFGRLIMCHMIADTTEELHAMADKIGVARRWCQHPGTSREHYDICLSKRAKAVNAGAVEVTQRELVSVMIERRKTALERPLSFSNDRLNSIADFRQYVGSLPKSPDEAV